MPRAAAASAAAAVAVPGRTEVRLRDALTRAGRLATSAEANAAMFVRGIRGVVVLSLPWRFPHQEIIRTGTTNPSGGTLEN